MIIWTPPLKLLKFFRFLNNIFLFSTINKTNVLQIVYNFLLAVSKSQRNINGIIFYVTIFQFPTDLVEKTTSSISVVISLFKLKMSFSPDLRWECFHDWKISASNSPFIRKILLSFCLLFAVTIDYNLIQSQWCL